MKNVILGVVGGFVIIYMVIIELTVFGIQSRENELMNCLSLIVMNELERHYIPEIFREDGSPTVSEATVQREIQQELERRILSDTEFTVDIIACDMEKGLLSVRVSEVYRLPNGCLRQWSYAKTAIIE